MSAAAERRKRVGFVRRAVRIPAWRENGNEFRPFGVGREEVENNFLHRLGRKWFDERSGHAFT